MILVMGSNFYEKSWQENQLCWLCKMTKITEKYKKILLDQYTSRFNKLHLITGWKHFHNYYIEYKWSCNPFNSRMLFQFEPDGPWIQSKSFEEDLLPTYKFGTQVCNK